MVDETPAPGPPDRGDGGQASGADRGALMQKVIPPRLLVPFLSGERTVIAGYVYRVQDSRYDSPAELFDALDLDFEGSELTAEVPELYVLRWHSRDGDDYVVPYGPQMGGDWNDVPPFTGNGFTTSRLHVVPQFHTIPMPIPAGAEIIRITAEAEELFASFDGLTWSTARVPASEERVAQ